MVEVKHMTYSYGHSSNVLENVGFDIQDGHCVAVLGNNGAGKSTLLKCIDHIIPTKEGVVLVDGKNAFDMSSRTLAKHIAYVPQNAGAVDLTVFDTVLLGRKPYIKWDTTEEDREIAASILHQMGLESYALRNVSELSGGEAQKVLIARALAQQPRFLLLDEPTSSLDPKNQHEVLQIVTDIAKRHRICVMIILHDLNLAVRYCDRFLFLKDSNVYGYGGAEVLSEETIEAVYGMKVRMMDCEGIPVIVPFPKSK